LGDQDIDRRIILKWTSEKRGGKVWIGFVWLRKGTKTGRFSNGD